MLFTTLKIQGILEDNDINKCFVKTRIYYW
jgi:hypothetical protein